MDICKYENINDRRRELRANNPNIQGASWVGVWSRTRRLDPVSEKLKQNKMDISRKMNKVYTYRKWGRTKNVESCPAKIDRESPTAWSNALTFEMLNIPTLSAFPICFLSLNKIPNWQRRHQICLCAELQLYLPFTPSSPPFFPPLAYTYALHYHFLDFHHIHGCFLYFSPIAYSYTERSLRNHSSIVTGCSLKMQAPLCWEATSSNKTHKLNPNLHFNKLLR